MRFDFPPGIGDGLPNSRRRRAARNIVDSEHRLQAQAGIEILIKGWIQLA